MKRGRRAGREGKRNLATGGDRHETAPIGLAPRRLALHRQWRCGASTSQSQRLDTVRTLVRKGSEGVRPWKERAAEQRMHPGPVPLETD